MNLDTLQAINQMGLLPFLGVFLFGPLLGFAGVLYVIIKMFRTAFAGGGKFLREITTEFVSEQKEKLKLEYEIKDTLQDLAKSFEGLVKKNEEVREGMWDNRRYIDESEKRIVNEVKKVSDMTSKIYVNMYKRKSDTIAFLQERTEEKPHD